MIDRLLLLGMIITAASAVFGGLLSCGHSKTYMTPRVNPLTKNTELWHEGGIIIWRKLPVRVYVKKHIMQDALREDARDSIEMWNSAIGCEVFRLSDDERAEITIDMGVRPKYFSKNVIASAKYTKRGRALMSYWGGDIRVYRISLADKAHRVNVMSHEFGHLLGFRDQYDDSSSAHIMHGMSRYGTYIDPEGLLFLRATYCW